VVDFKALNSAVAAEREVVSERSDLFAWTDALFSKARLDGTPPVYVMHRFLASDRLYASVARWLGQRVREPDLVVGCWYGLLPKQHGAPRLSYPAAKKPPAAELLVQRVMAVGAHRRETAEQMIAIVEKAGRLDALYTEFGIERDVAS